MKPITPREILTEKAKLELQRAKNIPDFVISAFNELIVMNYSEHNQLAEIKQEAVVNLIEKRNPEIDRQSLYENHWLDVEPLFEEVGWKVSYNKAPYYETASSYFTFTRR